MINNDVLRSIRYMLDLGDQKVVEITRLADPGFAIDKDDVRAMSRAATACSRISWTG